MDNRMKRLQYTSNSARCYAEDLIYRGWPQGYTTYNKGELSKASSILMREYAKQRELRSVATLMDAIIDIKNGKPRSLPIENEGVPLFTKEPPADWPLSPEDWKFFTEGPNSNILLKAAALAMIEHNRVTDEYADAYRFDLLSQDPKELNRAKANAKKQQAMAAREWRRNLSNLRSPERLGKTTGVIPTVIDWGVDYSAKSNTFI